MDRLVSLHDRETIGAFLRRNAPLHLYALGDLDDFFWPSTLWYGLERDGELRQLILGSVAGIHVYSPRQRMAALGNIVTHPAARGKGYASRVTARLCRERCSGSRSTFPGQRAELWPWASGVRRFSHRRRPSSPASTASPLGRSCAHMSNLSGHSSR
jgi:GNAT superfamily N-acetyltransferase